MSNAIQGTMVTQRITQVQRHIKVTKDEATYENTTAKKRSTHENTMEIANKQSKTKEDANATQRNNNRNTYEPNNGTSTDPPAPP